MITRDQLNAALICNADSCDDCAANDSMLCDEFGQANVQEISRQMLTLMDNNQCFTDLFKDIETIAKPVTGFPPRNEWAEGYQECQKQVRQKINKMKEAMK